MTNKQVKQDEARAKPRRPIRSLPAALGVGLGWAALHMPASLTQNSDLITWGVHALAAAFIAKAVLDLAGSALAWSARAGTALLARMRS
jgi:hypothetical protein